MWNKAETRRGGERKVAVPTRRNEICGMTTQRKIVMTAEGEEIIGSGKNNKGDDGGCGCSVKET